LLTTATTYTATVSGAKDAAGNVMPGPVAWTFTTEAAPALTGETPAPGATNVPTTTPVTATFNKSVVASTLAFTLKDAAGNAVTTSLSYDDTTHTATWTPSAALASNTTYTAPVTAAKAATGTPPAAPLSWSFPPATPVGAGPFSIWAATATPTVPDVNDPNPVEIGVKFRSDVAGFIDSIRFYKGAG